MKRALVLAALAAAALSAQGTTVLYTQDFENPTGFVNDGADVNIFRTVNQLYGNQPPGFLFAQANTVETLLVGGSGAWVGPANPGGGFKDPQGVAGRHVLGMLSDVQNDLLGLSFNVGAFNFLNFQLDISSIDLNAWGGPFQPAQGTVPTFRLTLYDNASGAAGLGTGSVLDTADITGVAAPNRWTFNWTNHIVALDATGNTNGNVILRIDLLSGGYAAMDNFRIAASDEPGDVGGNVSEPASLSLAALALAALGALRRRRG
jgi:MYXO-CTERM domain-containing protein